MNKTYKYNEVPNTTEAWESVTANPNFMEWYTDYKNEVSNAIKELDENIDTVEIIHSNFEAIAYMRDGTQVSSLDDTPLAINMYNIMDDNFNPMFTDLAETYAEIAHLLFDEHGNIVGSYGA